MREDSLSRARIRPARSEDDLQRAEAFLKTPRMREVVEGHPEERGSVRICEIDDEIVGAILLDPTPLRIRGIEVKCARILEHGGDDGRITFRETGNREFFVLLLEETLGYVWVKRYPISYAHGELALYPNHGFVPCFYHPRVYVDVASALTLAMPCRVRRLKADDVSHVQKLRTQHRRWKPIVYSGGVPAFHHYCVEDPDRRICGYFSFRANPKSQWYPPLFTPEVDADGRDAAATIIRHCAEQAQSLGLEEIHFPVGPGHPVARLCLELGGHAAIKGASKDPFVDEEMIHLVDPRAMIEALAPWFERRLARAGAMDTDAVVPFTTSGGGWSLHVRGGKVTLKEATKRVADCIDLPGWVFTQLLTGYRGVAELDAETTDEQRDLLELLLPKTWPYSLPDPDVWDAVTPKMPYSEAAAAVVRGTRLPWS